MGYPPPKQVKSGHLMSEITGLEILYIWAAGLRAKKKPRSQKPKKKGKKEEMGREKKKRRGVRWKERRRSRAKKTKQI